MNPISRAWARGKARQRQAIGFWEWLLYLEAVSEVIFR